MLAVLFSMTLRLPRPMPRINSFLRPIFGLSFQSKGLYGCGIARPQNTKKRPFKLSFVLRAEYETRAHVVGIFSRIIFTPPAPGRGVWGRSVRAAYHQRKKAVNRLPSFSLSGKRESVHLLSTLYIKQLPLPSTILPIRGTLGLFQGVVFESDFCHTNFRTTVAYDKFTNNF